MGNSESTVSPDSNQGDELLGGLDLGIYTDFFVTLTAASGVSFNLQEPNQSPKVETSDSRSSNFSEADESVAGRASGINRKPSSLSSLFPSVPSPQSSSNSPSLSTVDSSRFSTTIGNSNANSISSAFDSRNGITTIGGDGEDGDIVLLGNFDVEDEGSTEEEPGDLSRPIHGHDEARNAPTKQKEKVRNTKGITSFGREEDIDFLGDVNAAEGGFTDEELGEISRPIHSRDTARNASRKQQKTVPNTKKATNEDSKITSALTKGSAVPARRWSHHSRKSIRRARTEYAIPEHLEYAFTAHAADRLRLTFAFYDRDR